MCFLVATHNTRFNRCNPRLVTLIASLGLLCAPLVHAGTGTYDPNATAINDVGITNLPSSTLTNGTSNIQITSGQWGTVDMAAMTSGNATITIAAYDLFQGLSPSTVAPTTVTLNGAVAPPPLSVVGVANAFNAATANVTSLSVPAAYVANNVSMSNLYNYAGGSTFSGGLTGTLVADSGLVYGTEDDGSGNTVYNYSNSFNQNHLATMFAASGNSRLIIPSGATVTLNMYGMVPAASNVVLPDGFSLQFTQYTSTSGSIGSFDFTNITGTKSATVTGSLGVSPKFINFSNSTVEYTGTSSNTNFPVAGNSTAVNNTLQIGSTSITNAVAGNITPGSMYDTVNLVSGTVGNIDMANMGTDGTYSASVVNISGAMASVGDISTTTTLGSANDFKVVLTSTAQTSVPKVTAGDYAALVFDVGGANTMGFSQLFVPSGYANLIVNSGSISAAITATSMSEQLIQLDGGVLTGTVTMEGGIIDILNANTAQIPTLSSANNNNTLRVSLPDNNTPIGITNLQPGAGFSTVNIASGVLQTAAGSTYALDTSAMTTPTVELSGGLVSSTSSITLNAGTMNITGTSYTSGMTLPTIASGTGNTLSIDPSTSQTVSMAQTSANTFTVPSSFSTLSLTSGTLNASTASTVLDMTSMTQPTLAYAGGALGGNISGINLQGGTVQINTTAAVTYPTLSADAQSAIAGNNTLLNTYDIVAMPPNGTTGDSLTPSAQFGYVTLTGSSAGVSLAGNTIDMSNMTSGNKVLTIAGDSTNLTAYPTFVGMDNATVILDAMNVIPPITNSATNLSLRVCAADFNSLIDMTTLDNYDSMIVAGTINGATVRLTGTGSNLAVVSDADGAVSNLTLQLAPESASVTIIPLTTANVNNRYIKIDLGNYGVTSGDTNNNTAYTVGTIDTSAMAVKELLLSTQSALTSVGAITMSGGTINVANDAALGMVLNGLSQANASSTVSFGNNLELNANVTSAVTIPFGNNDVIQSIDLEGSNNSYTISNATLQMSASAATLPTLGGTNNILSLNGYGGSVDLTGDTQFASVSYLSGDADVNLGSGNITLTLQANAAGSPVFSTASGAHTLALADVAIPNIAVPLSFGPSEAFSALPTISSFTNITAAFNGASIILAEGFANAQGVSSVYNNLSTYLQNGVLGTNNNLVINDSTAVYTSSTVTLPAAFANVTVQKGTFGNIQTATAANYAAQTSGGTVFQSLTLSNLGAGTTVGDVLMQDGGTLLLSGDTVYNTTSLGLLSASSTTKNTTLAMDFSTSDEYLVSTAGAGTWLFTGVSAPAECINIGTDTNGNPINYCVSKYGSTSQKEVKDELISRKVIRTSHLFDTLKPGQLYPHSSYEERRSGQNSLPGYNNIEVGVAYSTVRDDVNWLFDLAYEKSHTGGLYKRDRYEVLAGARTTLLPNTHVEGFAQLQYNINHRNMATVSSGDVDVSDSVGRYTSVLLNASIKHEEFINDRDYKVYGAVHLSGQATPSYKQWLYNWKGYFLSQVMPEVGVGFTSHLQEIPIHVRFYAAYNAIITGLEQDYSIGQISTTYRQRNFSALTSGGEITALAFPITDVSLFGDYRSDKSYSGGVRITMHAKRLFSWSSEGFFQDHKAVTY